MNVIYDNNNPLTPPPCLLVRNNDSSFFKSYEIQVPYMLTCQISNLKENKFTFINLSPSNNSRIHFSKEDNPALDSRTEHSHNFFELIFVMSGEVYQWIEGKRIHYSVGEGCILNKNIKHQEEFSTNFEVLYLALTDQFLSDLITNDIQYSKNGICHNYFGSIYHLIEQNSRSKCYDAKEYINFIPIKNLHQDNTIMNEFFSH